MRDRLEAMGCGEALDQADRFLRITEGQVLGEKPEVVGVDFCSGCERLHREQVLGAGHHQGLRCSNGRAVSK